MKAYRAPRGDAVRRTTAVAAIVLVAGAMLPLLRAADGAGPSSAASALLLVGVAAALWGARAAAPSGFTIDGASVRVERRWFGPVRIPLAEVRSAQVLPSLAGQPRILGGSAGVFGYSGYAWTAGLGAFRIYATRREQLVRIDTDRETFVLSPDPAEAFVADLRGRAPHVRLDAPAVRRPPPVRAWFAPLVPAILVGAWVLSVYASAGERFPVGASVSGDAVVIEYAGGRPPVAIPLAAVRRIDVLGVEARGSFRRAGGARGPGGRGSGRWRSEALGEFELYAWRRGAPVLLETTGGSLVLTPDDPERFASAVRARLAR